jgi:hypothetical protein
MGLATHYCQKGAQLYFEDQGYRIFLADADVDFLFQMIPDWPILLVMFLFPF